MKFWRITQKKWALDKLCAGARDNGGRWNPPGHPAMYASATIELCAMEKFVHLAGVSHPPMVLVSIEAPDDIDLYVQPPLKALPKAWAEMPTSASAQKYGRRWLDSVSHLGLMVPSAIIPEALNVMVNPAHPAYKEVKLKIVRPFTFDIRMIGKTH